LHIAFVIPDLGPGGAERVATLLANYWVSQGHDVTVATFEMSGTEPFFPVERRVVVRELEAPAASRWLTGRLGNNIARVSRLRSLLRDIRPDIVVAFMTEANVVALCAAQGLGVPVVISERNQPDRPGLGPIHRFARRLAYPLARAMVVQTEAIAAWAIARFNIPMHVIPNPVLLELCGAASLRGSPHLLVSLGRLSHQKGYDLLLKSFAALAGKHPDWQLIIYGEGPERAQLERLQAESGYAKQISLPGLTRDSLGALRQASLFVLPSRFEGYPNALLEALGCGLPIVATVSPGGTAEILADGAYGMLVPPDDVSALTAALDAMMSSPELRNSYAARARPAVAELDVASISGRWLDLLKALAGRRGLRNLF
jgi:glycosyltransferase involved in cell wall biosynthesis